MTQTFVRRLDGPDCSHYQPDAGPVDLSVTRSSGSTYIAWKATQSIAYTDPTFNTYRMISKAVGFHTIMMYHWLSSTKDPVAQADFYLRTVKVLNPNEGVMLDAEEAGITVEKCLAWMERVESVTHLPCAIYTGIYVAGGTIYKDPRIRTSKYGRRMVHLAAYISASALTAILTRKGLIDLPVDAWQWSSNGPVPGITGRCDMNAILNPAGFNSITVQPAPWPPFDPAHCLFGLYPVAVKPTIKQGAAGDIVKYLQGVIYCKAGGNITVDGIFGPATTVRVKDLQRMFKLTVDGIVGPQTWKVVDFLSQRA